jgi:hypothetical protein
MNPDTFTAERISRSATIILEGPVDTVFPLFGPIEEMKWEDGWDPVILYPVSGEPEEGMFFTTRAQDHDETTYAWIVAKYNPEMYLIEYIVSTHNRCWVITIQCTALPGNRTQTTVRYTFTGLTALGNELNRRAIQKIYTRNLKDWEEAINYYLKAGMILKRH